MHQGNDLGYGKNAKDWIIRSQVLRAERSMDAVQRLYGSRSWITPGLKIESGRPEMGLKDERPNQPGALRCLAIQRCIQVA